MRPTASPPSARCLAHPASQHAWFAASLPAQFLLLVLFLLLTGCAGNERLKDVRAFAASAPKLTGYADLSQRYRDTYQRELPYLNPAAQQRELALDQERRAAYPDLVALQAAVMTYLRALGALAGGDQFDPGDQIKDFATGIKAWPDTGLTDRHVNAVSGLTRALSRLVTSREQDKAVQQLLRDGYVPLRDALDGMGAVLRYYDKHHDNEQAIVLGMLETEIPFADRPPERLLAALAKAHRQEKANEYRLLGLRHTLAANQVRELQERLEALHRKLDAPPASERVATTTAPTNLAQGARP